MSEAAQSNQAFILQSQKRAQDCAAVSQQHEAASVVQLVGFMQLSQQPMHMHGKEMQNRYRHDHARQVACNSRVSFESRYGV